MAHDHHHCHIPGLSIAAITTGCGDGSSVEHAQATTPYHIILHGLIPLVICYRILLIVIPLLEYTVKHLCHTVTPLVTFVQTGRGDGSSLEHAQAAISHHIAADPRRP